MAAKPLHLVGPGADERALPHNLEAEKSVLGAILLHNDALAVASAILTAPDFFRDAHRRIFTRMLGLADRGTVVDLVTIKDDLARIGELDAVDGPAYLAGLIDGVPRSTNVEHYAKIIKEKAALRSVIFSGTKIVAAAYDQQADASTIVDVAQRDLALISEQAIGHLAASFPPLLSEADLEHTADKRALVQGILNADESSALVSLPGAGKTTFAVGLGLGVAYGVPVIGRTVTTSGPVVFVVGEGSIKLKVRTWKQAHGFSLTESNGFYVCPQRVNLTDAREVDRFIRLCRPIRPVLTIYDTLARCGVGADENSSRDMGLLLDATDRIGRAVGGHKMLLHHTTKDGSTERGSGALRGGVDTLMKLTATDDLLSLSCEKQRDEEAFAPIALRLVPGSDQQACLVRLRSDVVLPAAGVVTKTQARCLAILRESSGPAGATIHEWQRAASAEIPERSFYRARAVLEKAGYIRTTKGKAFVWTGIEPLVEGDN